MAVLKDEFNRITYGAEGMLQLAKMYFGDIKIRSITYHFTRKENTVIEEYIVFKHEGRRVKITALEHGYSIWIKETDRNYNVLSKRHFSFHVTGCPLL